jgi:hypothetical protein
LPDIRLRAQNATRKHNAESEGQRLHDQILIVIIAFPQSSRSLSRLLTPALSSFEEEREIYFVGRFSGVGARRHRTDPGLISFAPMGQASFRLHQTSARQIGFAKFLKSVFIGVHPWLKFFASPRLCVNSMLHPVRTFEQYRNRWSKTTCDSRVHVR